MDNSEHMAARFVIFLWHGRCSLIKGLKENPMKAMIYGLLALVVALVVLAMPMKAMARDHDGWHHDHGNHWGWYKHHGGYGYRGYGYHHHDHDWYEHHGYGGYAYGYGGYPENMVCDYDGDDCRPVPLMTVPWGYPW
jgi:hypothetical protein